MKKQSLVLVGLLGLMASLTGNSYADSAAQKKAFCASLSAQRDRIVAAQRRGGTASVAEGLRRQLKAIDDKMFSAGC